MIANFPETGRVIGRSVLILATGIIAGLLVTSYLMVQLLQAPAADISLLVWELATVSAASIGIGFAIYMGIAQWSYSLKFSLIFAYVWTAALVLFNVWNGARLMFFEPHDFYLAIILLVFAAIIATAFGFSVSARVANGLAELSHTLRDVAGGDFDQKVEVRGRDEVAHIAESFNQMTDQLREAEQTRREAEQMRRDLVAWVSHDLRTPLTSIRAMIEALHDGVVTNEETRQRYYRNMNQDIMALDRLLDDLFELAQLEAGGLTLDVMEHDLGDLLSDTMGNFNILSEQKGVTIQAHIGDGVGRVPLDARKIERVLSNLVGNALRYTPADGEITVTAEMVADKEVCIRVKDSGSGFAPEDLGRVFEKFYRGEQARTRSAGGAES